SQEVTTDAMIVPQRGQDWFDGGHWIRLHRHEYQPDDPIINGAWNFLFGGVNTTNRLIFQFEELNAPGSEAFIAELRVLRAMFYMGLLDSYGNVPLVDRFDVPADFAPNNATREEIYNFIENELTATVDLLTEDVSGATYARINKWTAHAILAKLYLNAEVYTGTPQWQKAADNAAAIVNSGNYRLESSFFTNFQTENSGSGENIFVIPYDQVFATGHNLVMRTLHYSSQNTFNLTAQPWNGYCSLQEFYNSFEENDVRRGSFIVGPQLDAAGQPLGDDGFEQADPNDPTKPFDADGVQVNFTPEINEHFPNALRQAGARIGKYEFATGATQDLSNDVPIFRYADILLIQAEAMWRMNAGSAEALALVNEIRVRAGVDPFADLTAETLLAERGREMFAEAWRRQDLIRFGVYGDEWEFKPASDETKEIFPIPRAQIDANPNLTQNPGYN
ncbi:MAG: RagB/SusD family nutrient uptake outer membrane protein, partial [Bacteroidota bacterium]